MNVTTIPATLAQAAAVRAQLTAQMATSLPDDAVVSGDWISAPEARDGAVVYVHGGGFAHTNPEAERLVAYRLSKATGRPVLRVDYRLAPAHPYPAAMEDVLAAYRSVLDRGVPEAEVVLVGESAGGTLVLSALLELARTGGSPPGAAVAISPVTDLALESPSLSANDGKDLMNRAVLEAVRTQYLAGAEAREAPQSPLYGEPRGLPPLLIAAGSDEVLLDDARGFAETADAAGVSVRLEIYEGMPHAFHLSEVGEVLFGRVGQWLADPVREFTVSGREAGPYALAEGADGALWFTLVHQGAIGRRSPEGELSAYPVGAGPTVIVPGPDDALWFTEYQRHRIGRIGLDGRVDSFELPTAQAGPFGIAAGPDGALWFTQTNAGRVGRITVEGKVTDYPSPGAFPSAITAGPDGAMWFTLNQANAIGRITMDGDTTAYPLPTEAAAPVGITAGPDGALWFVEIGAGQIGRVTVDGTITEYPLPDRGARPHAIVTGPDGALWFTEWGGNRVGRITVDGRITSYDLPTPGSEPHGIACHGGALWCALEIGALARIEVPA
ncbi:virginiamycin B lyase family protein [Nonomuraea africana]|uniref:Virginiamycin B lyase n=1 Tax=Nonomuraea africana TaxID=46171 RepID=A0ABR9KD85_9ACTN|nr:alpha/beta hydrolase fold domain-containing protein [Nonomuraea africana]MBE1559512.1 virginiamycin B lyase [Nonomuraea africana]